MASRKHMGDLWACKFYSNYCRNSCRSLYSKSMNDRLIVILSLIRLIMRENAFEAFNKQKIDGYAYFFLNEAFKLMSLFHH